MASIHTLLNASESPKRSRSRSPSPQSSHVSHEDDPDEQCRSEPESYDRAQVIASSVARSMTATPTPAPKLTIRLNTLPPVSHGSSSKVLSRFENQSDQSVTANRPPKSKSKRLASPITSIADIHYRRYISPSPSPSATGSGVTPRPSTNASRAASPSPSIQATPSPTPTLLYSPSNASSGVASPRKKLKLHMGVTSHPKKSSPSFGKIGGVSDAHGADVVVKEKPRIIKDAPVYVAGGTRGEVRYPPSVYGADAIIEVGGEERSLKEYHDLFQIFPPEYEVGKYPRCIPYNSERRVFADKTGRDFFEVFQYEFSVPGHDDKRYTMLWDYNIGLVRTTPLFKCCGYGKTTPAKMLNKNVGLRDICHSITGGALVAQGYWIPYAAAKAVAATFCYSIRYALTPVFGIDFIDLCIPPHEEGFGSMMIDAEITRFSTQQAREYYKIELEDPSPRVGATVSPGMGFRSPKYPASPVLRYNKPVGTGVGVPSFNAINRIMPAAVNDQGGISSDYDTEESGDVEDMYALSPESTTSPTGPHFRNVWTATKMPRNTLKAALFREDEMVSPKTKTMTYPVRGRMTTEGEDEDYEVKTVGSRKRVSPKAKLVEGLGLRKMEIDEEYDADDRMEVDEIGLSKGEASLRYHAGGGQLVGQTKAGTEAFSELDATKALMQLKYAPWVVKKVPGRRASA